MTVLELQDIHHDFSGLQVLSGVDLAVRGGDRHAVIGPNGAGKSTLFNIITGRFAPRRGREAWWAEALGRSETVIVYEAPTRVPATLAAIAAAAPERAVCLARELTKVHEEFVAGAAGAVVAELAGRAERLRGECVIVAGGATDAAAGPARPWPEALRALRDERTGRSLSARGLVDVLACVYPGERNAIYRAVQEEAGG